MSSPAALAVEKLGGLSTWVWEGRVRCNSSVSMAADLHPSLHLEKKESGHPDEGGRVEGKA